MSEHDERAGEDSTDAGHGVEESVVSDVLASIQALDGRSVDEHVGVFERAHERLRRALDQRHG